MRKFSISDKLILASLFLSIVTIIIVASYSFYFARQAILERTFDQLTSVRVVKTNLLEDFFLNRMEEAQLICTSKDIRDVTYQINQDSGSVNLTILDNKLVKIDNAFLNEISNNHYTNISVVGNNNHILHLKYSQFSNIETNNEYQSLWSNTILSETPIITDLTKRDSLSQPIITISSKITSESNDVIGMIIFELSHNSIDAIMLEYDKSTGFGTSGESYLVGHDLLMRSSSRFQENSVLSTIVKTEAVERAFKGNTGTKIIDDYRGVKVLSSYGKINVPNLDWIILAEIDFEEATIPIYRTRNEIVFISIFIFLLVLIVVYILSKRITFPIQRLNHAAREIGEGNLDVEIKHNLNDEIGDLTDTFNEMIHQLKDKTEELNLERIKRLSSLYDGQEIERQRLSRELHDSLGQQILAIKMKLEQAYYDDNEYKEILNETIELSSSTAKEIRNISNNLSPAVLSEFGLETAINNLIRELINITGIDVELISEIPDDLESKQETYVFRICQEAINNITKYSNASKVSIHFSVKNNTLFIDISDNGEGFEINDNHLTKGNGLSNMKERAHLLNGSFCVNSEPGHGTHICISIPLNLKQ